MRTNTHIYIAWKPRRLFLFLLLFIWPQGLWAQSTPPGFRHFTADDGLPSSEVYEVLQDRQGYIWFSTDNGVSRFDGIEFQNYGALQGLTEPVVFNMQEDHQGRIWMQSMLGHLYYLEEDTIRAFLGNRWLDSMKIGQTSTIDFYVDTTGIVYNSVYPLGLFSFALGSSEGRFEVHDIHASGVYMIDNKALLVQSLNQLRLEEARQLEGVWREKGQRPLFIHTAAGKQVHMLADDLSVDYMSVRAFEKGALLVNRNEYLFGFKAGELMWQQRFPEKVISWLQGTGQDIYLGLNYRKGVRRYRNLSSIPAGEYETYLEGYSISHIMRDKEGGFWFTTNESGVFYQPNPNVQIFNQQSSLPLQSVTALAIANEQELFLGFDGNGVFKLDSYTGVVSALPLAQKRVDDLLYDKPRQVLWAAGTEYLQSYRNGRWEIMCDTARSAVVKRKVGYAARHLHITHDKDLLWIASHSGFVKMGLSPQSGLSASTDRQLFGPGYLPTRTYDICTTYEGHTYVSNINGLHELVDNSLKRLPVHHPAIFGRVEAIEELADSTLVLGTKGYGLVFWKKDRIASLTEQDGLTANMIENLHVDDKGNLWAGTLNGLNRVRWSWSHKPSIKNITIAHGLPSNEVTDIKTIGHKLWVATMGGLACFDGEIRRASLPPKPIIERLWVNEKPYALHKITPSALALRSDERNLRIQFVSLQYANANNVQYRYRLHPTDPWVVATGRNLNFAALTDGKYQLELQARNTDRVWSSSVVLRFVIPPYWWQKTWFVVLAAVSVLAVAYGAYVYRTRQIVREDHLQRQIVGLEYSALQAQMNPHFIFNCLNSIQNFILQNEKTEAIEYLNGFARLVRGMLNASVSGSITLMEEVKLLENYLLLEQLRFNHRFTYTVKTQPGLEVHDIKIPPLLIQPYVENAVLHGIADKASNGRVEVFFEEKNGFLVVSITDNGKGTQKAQVKGDIPKSSYDTHKSVGMGITGRRLELLSDLHAQEAVETTDLGQEAGRPIGTRVTIRIKNQRRPDEKQYSLPLKSRHYRR